jgi:hypothetical protein
MYIQAHFDAELSRMAEVLSFFCDEYTLTDSDIQYLTHKKYLRQVDPETFPAEVVCNVVITCKDYMTARVTFSQPDFTIPYECYETPFLNQTLLDGEKEHGGLWLMCEIPLKDTGLRMELAYEG